MPPGISFLHIGQQPNDLGIAQICGLLRSFLLDPNKGLEVGRRQPTGIGPLLSHSPLEPGSHVLHLEPAIGAAGALALGEMLIAQGLQQSAAANRSAFAGEQVHGPLDAQPPVAVPGAIADLPAVDLFGLEHLGQRRPIDNTGSSAGFGAAPHQGVGLFCVLPLNKQRLHGRGERQQWGLAAAKPLQIGHNGGPLAADDHRNLDLSQNVANRPAGANLTLEGRAHRLNPRWLLLGQATDCLEIPSSLRKKLRKMQLFWLLLSRHAEQWIVKTPFLAWFF